MIDKLYDEQYEAKHQADRAKKKQEREEALVQKAKDKLAKRKERGEKDETSFRGGAIAKNR